MTDRGVPRGWGRRVSASLPACSAGERSRTTSTGRGRIRRKNQDCLFVYIFVCILFVGVFLPISIDVAYLTYVDYCFL